MAIMNNCATRPSALPFLTYIPEKIPWAVLQASYMIHKVHPSEKAVPVDQIIGSLGTFLETFKGEALIIKEEVDAKSDVTGVQSDLWYIWVMDVYPLVLSHKVKRLLEGLRMLCLRWCKRKVIHGMFKCIGDNYVGFYRTQEGETLGEGWPTGSRR